LQGIIEKWMAKIGDRQEILNILKRERVPVAPVLTLQEAINHPHAIQRGAIRQINDPHIGKFPIPGQPPIFSKWSHNDDLVAPLLGEHNEEILTTICGLDKSEIVALHEKGIITTDPTFLDPPHSILE
jgi:CoA:oxalate CoA-transferase